MRPDSRGRFVSISMALAPGFTALFNIITRAVPAPLAIGDRGAALGAQGHRVASVLDPDHLQGLILT